MTHDTTGVRDVVAPLGRLARAGFAVAEGPAVTADVRGRAAADPTGAVRVQACSPQDGPVADDTAGPDVWLVSGDQVVAERASGQAITADEARAVADLSRRVDATLGAPHEVEWAMTSGRLLVVAVGRRAVLPPGTWLKDVDRYPEPFTALGASVAGPAISAAFTAMLTRYGALLERAELRFVDGEAYLSITPAGGRDGGPPPAWLLGIVARTVPALRDRLRRAARTATGAALVARQRRYEEEVRPALQREVSMLRGIDLAGLSDEDLRQHLRAVLDLVRRALAEHFDLIPAEIVPVYGLVQWSSRVLGWDERTTLELLAGCSPATSSPTRSLAALAERIRTQPRLRDLVARGGDEMVADVTAADPVAGDLLRGWIDEFGGRPVHDDPGAPLFAERPDLVGMLVVEAVDRNGTPTEETAGTARELARARLARRPAEMVAFEQVLAAAERAYRLREDSARWTGSMPAGLVRRAAMECGRRLVAAGRLDHPEDVVHRPADTLLAALDPARHPGGLELRALVVEHRAGRERARRHPGPARYGPPPADPPDVRLLPEPARTLNAALLWSRPTAPRESGPDDPAGLTAPAVLVGLAGSSGRHTGPVRRVLTEADFALVRHGDVIVCRTTDPAWSVLFGIAGALVTDNGGLLSHAGIVAREFHLPAVLGTGHATSTLVDGQVVTVDGTTGRVRPAART